MAAVQTEPWLRALNTNNKYMKTSRSTTTQKTIYYIHNTSKVCENYNRSITNLEQVLMMDRQEFGGVKNYRNLGTLINSKKLISFEIKSRTLAGNRCYYSLR
jgi:hypothetical protein